MSQEKTTQEPMQATILLTACAVFFMFFNCVSVWSTNPEAPWLPAFLTAILTSTAVAITGAILVKKTPANRMIAYNVVHLVTGLTVACLIVFVAQFLPAAGESGAAASEVKPALANLQHLTFVTLSVILMSLMGLKFYPQTQWLVSFFTPVYLANLMLVAQSPASIVITVTLATVLCSLLYQMLRHKPETAQTQLMSEEFLPQTSSSLNEYIKRSQKQINALKLQVKDANQKNTDLESQLIQNQKSLEYKIAERTRELSEANELLNQQVKLRHNISDALAKSQARLNQAIEASQLGLWDWDLLNRRIYQSQIVPCLGKKDWSTEEYIEQLRSICPSDDFQRLTSAMADYLKGSTDYYRVSYRVHDKAKDEWLWVEDQGKAVKRDKDGKILRMMGIRRDITQERKQAEQLHLAQSVFDQTSEGIFVLDHRFRFIAVNFAFQKICGRTEKELLNTDWIDFSQTPQKAKVLRQARIELAKEGQWEAELFEKRSDGEYFPMRLQVNSICDREGDVNYYAGIVSDLTSGKETDEKLHYLLNYDELTGLTNRAQFKDRLHNALVNARNGLEKFALIMVDIDRFKHINQSLGHEKADHMLKIFATRLAAVMNKADTISRLGSDEFAIIIRAKNKDYAANAAQLILRETVKPFDIDGQELRISISLGVTLLPENGRELTLIMRQATLATRQAKYLGGNNFQFYSDQIQDFSKFRLTVESDLRKALANDELEVYYQPKLNLQTQRIDSVEALVRWNHPARGLIVPSDFVNIAEESGLIADLGADVLRAACQQAQNWRKQGIGDIKVSVNLSAYQLRQNKIINTVRNILQLTGLPPALLELELTESSIIENFSSTCELLQAFCDMGISLSVDDFGTGYSSFSYLKKLPVSSLKIDRMFIRDIHINDEDAAICKAIIVLGKNLNLQVVAEGVENSEQLGFLKAAGCHLVQGFLVSQPVCAEKMTHLLKTQCGKSSLPA